MKIKVRVEGLDGIGRNLRAMGGALQRSTLLPVMIEHVEPIADEMRARAARGTGEMADSVTVGTELSPHQRAIAEKVAEIEVYAGPGPLPQAVQVEFGNSHQAPQPFIRPAFDSGVNRALRGIGEDGVAAVLAAAKG